MMSNIESLPATDSHDATQPPRKRWRFTFRLSTLFVVITAIAIACAWPRIDREIHLYQLRPFINRDLRKLNDEEKAEFERVLNCIHKLPMDADFDLGFYSNWYLWDLHTARGRRLVLFRARPIKFPGSAHAKIFVFSDRGDFICQEEYFPGLRVDLVDAALTNEIPGETLIAADTRSFFGGALGRHYHALIDDCPVLIRREDSGKGLVTPFMLGESSQPLQQIPSADWLLRLRDKRETKLLLVLNEIYTEMAFFREIYPAFRKNTKLKLDPAVRERVSQLVKHPHPWVAEMATATLKKLPVAESE